MGTNQLAVIIQTILDEKGIVNDIPRIQKVLEKYTMNLTAEIDKKTFIKSVQSVLPGVIKELRNIPGVQIPIDIDFTDEKLIEKACAQVEQVSKRMQAEFEKTAAKSNGIQLSLNADPLQADQTVVRLNEQLRKNTAYSKEVPTQIRAWIDKLKNAWSKFGGWSFATETLMAGVHQTTEAFRELKEIDTILTEISKTSDRTQKSLENLGKSAVDSANKYGATISGYLSGVQEAAKAGFDDSQQEEIAELSILAQSAGDMADELANEYIITTNAAYRLNGEISKLNEVLDGQNYISNHNAVNMSELAEATKIVASQAASSNVEIDKLTASVGTMMAVTQQGGDIAARAFKAILMNIQQVSGEVADGEEISTDDLTKYQKACEELGVSLSEVKNGMVSLRDPMQVLKELSEAYTSLDKMDARRANLISAVGGKYRGNQLNALLENWDIYEKMLSEYAQGEGSALKEAQKTAESWQGLLNQISNNWTGFIQNFADDSLVTNTLKFINELVKGADSLVQTFGALPTLITAIGTGLGAKTSLDYRKQDTTHILQGSGKSYCYG